MPHAGRIVRDSPISLLAVCFQRNECHRNSTLRLIERTASKELVHVPMKPAMLDIWQIRETLIGLAAQELRIRMVTVSLWCAL